MRCLELGAGTGEFTVRLAESGCALTAIELSADTAAVCRARVGGGAVVIVGNVETGEGLHDREFDAIVGVSVLHHVDVPRCLATTFAHLGPGGRFAFSEPNILNPQVWAERNIALVGRARHTTEHETAFRAGELRRPFEDGGFRVDVCEPYEFLHPATPRGLIPLVERVERVVEATPARALAGSIRISGSRP